MSILIVDDEYLVRTSLISMLGNVGLPTDSIQEAITVEEMVSVVGQYLLDMAFVDIRMPGLNGRGIIRCSKALCALCRILKNAVWSAEQIRNAYAAGVSRRRKECAALEKSTIAARSDCLVYNHPRT